MLKIGKIYIDTEEIEILKEFENYYTHEINSNEIKETTKLSIAIYIANYWSDDCNNIDINYINNIYKATMYIPIYDWITVELYSEGTTKDIAENKVKEMFNDFIEYNNKYEENNERNLRKFMSQVAKFGVFYKNRKTSDLENRVFNDVEIVYDNPFTNTSFREFIVENGVPDDARVDSMIYGYVKDNIIVFNKCGFLKGQKDAYYNYIENHHNEIAKHYNLPNNYEVFAFITEYEDTITKDNNYPDSLIYQNYEYYIPTKKIK